MLGRSALACLGLVVAVVGPGEFAEDDIEGMTALLYDEAVYTPATTDCSSGSPEENELCE